MRYSQPKKGTAGMIFAYIDPGLGSMFIQALVAGLVGLPILFRRQVAGVLRLLRLDKESDSPARD